MWRLEPTLGVQPRRRHHHLSTNRMLPSTNAPHSIQSPLVKGADARLIDSIESKFIIRMYQNSYGIDVSDYFSSIEHVQIYECSATGYRFYYPFTLTGKEGLYRQLEATVDGKYKDDKWEYRKALTFIQPPSRVLDVGCGKGAFVKLAGQAGLDAHGLELNSASAAEARQRGLDVSTELIGEHAKTHQGFYDVICSFQVLEHIPNVREFIQDCIDALRPGGVLIIGVPNNLGFVGLDRTAALNMPPHHMGLWTKKSLTGLADVFPVDIKAVELEPLAEVDWYATVMERIHIPYDVFRFLYYQLGIAAYYRKWLKARADRLPGHTILAVYEKRQ